MIDVLMSGLVLLGLGVLTMVSASRQPVAMRKWVVVAYFEYMVCAGMQLVYSKVIVGGGDAAYYGRTGLALSRFLEKNFPWAAPEIFSLAIQQPSAFDKLVEAPGTNTASMAAVTAFQVYILRSDYAASFFVSGLALFGAMAIFKACLASYPEAPPVPLFVATVLFPSVAFWTSALHKETYCLIGIGLLFAAWRASYAGRVVGLAYAGLGVFVILLFRPPALPPIILGLAIYVLMDRINKARGGAALVIGPLYFFGALGLLAGAMVMLTRFSPKFGLERLGETMTAMQLTWATSRNKGESDFAHIDDVQEATIGGQLLHVPSALGNALFRPMFFDVHNFGSAVSAIEMTVMMWLLYRSIRVRGFGGTLATVQRSPFLMMCTVITMVGCAFVGLVTLNMGSLARYRVPFLPFYGALVACLAKRVEVLDGQPAPVVTPPRPPRRHRSLGPAPARRPL